ncbi:MAG: aminotransferase class III-fold pyridoxal phosphate-dependent enzyme [Bryobacteraceae bacterium]|nr:aminotransferase class III-fold pyridoxal phosphate-dependent enzyme [Bryobacteraceae bacterium]
MTFTTEAAAEVLLRLFQVQSEVSPLPSERDQNFLVAAGYVLKIANAAEERAMIEAENAALHRLAATGLCPRVVGDLHQEHGHFIRLITLLPGRPLGTLKHPGARLLEDLGRALAKTDEALAGFDHPALHREFHWDLARAERIAAADSELARRYREYAKPLLPRLRQSVIHNDANDFNVLVTDEPGPDRVTGIIDFGDMVYSHTVNNLAIALAYAALGQDRPLDAMCSVVRGYHSVFPLEEPEVEALFALAGMRLAVSAAIAKRQRAADPGNEYLSISQAAIGETAPKLEAIPPRLAWYRFREACGWTPVPWAPRVLAWIRGRGDFAPVAGAGLPVRQLDLSVAGRQPFPQDGTALHAGGYGEARTLYESAAFDGENRFDERRTIHLGVDLTVGAGAEVCAPLAGVVHAFEDASGALDYGPVVVLKHDAGGDPLFTLYGHLSRDSLQGLRIGQELAQGQAFARVGTKAENGGWWPHVHFQLILDMLDVPCNFNGCALPRERGTWMSLCPDPNLVLRLPIEAAPPADIANLTSRRRARTGGNLSISYPRQPIHAARGQMQYLFDSSGRRYLDAYNNVPHVGHSHPRVVEAVCRQLGILNTNTRYLQDQLVDYAEALTGTLPGELSVCYFTASGSEANELALRLARAYTRAKDLLVMDAAYHGHTTTLIDISPYKHNGPGGSGPPDWVHVTPIPDVYRGKHRGGDAGIAYANEVAGVIRGLKRGLCGYIAETCPSVAGQILLPPGFLPAVYAHVRKAGGVCIADEVQTGFGRMGTHFWAFQQHGVVPDVVVMGKPIANGYPMGAVVCRPEIARAFENGMEFFSTFGGSTAALAAARETLRVTLEEGLQDHALRVGSALLSRLREIPHPLIGDVRGSGLFAGIELVRDRETREPAGREASLVAERMRDRGILAGTDGPWHNVIKLRGPMSITLEDVDILARTLARALDEI